jgi:hypothetical protein
MVGISYDNHPRLKRILMPESWIGWPLRKDYITPNFYEIQDAHWMIRNSCSLIQYNTTPDFIQVKEDFYVLFLDETEYLFIILEFIPIIQKGPDRLSKKGLHFDSPIWKITYSFPSYKQKNTMTQRSSLPRTLYRAHYLEQLGK